jgi:microcystin-dependent protein
VTVQSGANLQLQPGATSNICPIGTILMMANQSSFSGWLSCNGASCATTGTYAGLFAVIGYLYGGSGATFNVPDFQGAFLRGYGSPSTARNLSYASNAFGTYQPSQMGDHSHTLNTSNNGVSSSVGTAYIPATINAQTTTTTETRPYNYAVQYYIKY